MPRPALETYEGHLDRQLEREACGEDGPKNLAQRLRRHVSTGTRNQLADCRLIGQWQSGRLALAEHADAPSRFRALVQERQQLSIELRDLLP
jgi:hypothetical protein